MELAELEDRTSLQRIGSFFSHPVVVAICAISTIIAIPLSIYFYLAADKHPELSVFVNPARAAVVDSSASSKLKVSIDNIEVHGDITAAQVAIWNAGSAPIHSAEILEKLTLQTEPTVPILEATIRRSTRSVVQLALDPSQMTKGSVAVSWNILESGDGGIVQLVYSGGPEVRIKAAGVIEGQHAVKQLSYSGKIQSPRQQMQAERQMRWINLGILASGVAILTFALNRITRRGRPKGWVEWALLANASLCIGMAVWQIIRESAPNPPFGF